MQHLLYLLIHVDENIVRCISPAVFYCILYVFDCICFCVHSCVCACACVHVCLCVRARARMRTYVHVYVCVSVSTLYKAVTGIQKLNIL